MSANLNLLNEGAVRSLLDELLQKARPMEATIQLQQIVFNELQHTLRRYARNVEAEDDSILPIYANLNPTDEQLRNALVKLMSLPGREGSAREWLFFSSRQWICIFKVLVFLRKANTDYGCMACMENTINRIFFGHESPRVACRQDDLTKKHAGIFAGTLEEWEQSRYDHLMRDYWPLTLRFLQILHAECGCECRSEVAVTEVVTYPNSL